MSVAFYQNYGPHYVNIYVKNNSVLPTTSNVAFIPFPTTFLYIYLVYNFLGMGMVDLIIGTFLTAWSRLKRKPLLQNKKKKYYYKKIFL